MMLGLFAVFKTAVATAEAASMDLEGALISRVPSGRRRRQEFLEAAGPTLLVLTFLEDSLRVVQQWEGQMAFMQSTMRLGYYLGATLLFLSMLVQTVGSLVVLHAALVPSAKLGLAKRATWSLLAFTIVQPFMYGELTNIDFLCRSLTLAGGLLLCTFAQSKQVASRPRASQWGLPQSNFAADKLQLFGRLMLTLLFFFEALAGSNSGGLHSLIEAPRLLPAVTAVALIAAAVLIAVGFKTEWSALLLAGGLVLLDLSLLVPVLVRAKLPRGSHALLLLPDLVRSRRVDVARGARPGCHRPREEGGGEGLLRSGGATPCAGGP